MKKIIIILLITMNLTTVCAVNETPRYKIIGSSYRQEDIDEMYKVKDQLLLNYKKWGCRIKNKYYNILCIKVLVRQPKFFYFI